MKNRPIGSVALLACLVLPACASPPTSAPPAEPKLVDLLRQSLSDAYTGDVEILISYVELPPNAALERHWHPGEEFQYFLAGSAEIIVDGQPPVVSAPGEVGHIPYGAVHTAVAGPEGARAVVFRVHTKGQPIRILAEDDAGAP